MMSEKESNLAVEDIDDNDLDAFLKKYNISVKHLSWPASPVLDKEDMPRHELIASVWGGNNESILNRDFEFYNENKIFKTEEAYKLREAGIAEFNDCKKTISDAHQLIIPNIAHQLKAPDANALAFCVDSALQINIIGSAGKPIKNFPVTLRNTLDTMGKTVRVTDNNTGLLIDTPLIASLNPILNRISHETFLEFERSKLKTMWVNKMTPLCQASDSEGKTVNSFKSLNNENFSFGYISKNSNVDSEPGPNDWLKTILENLTNEKNQEKKHHTIFIRKTGDNFPTLETDLAQIEKQDKLLHKEYKHIIDQAEKILGTFDSKLKKIKKEFDSASGPVKKNKIAPSPEDLTKLAKDCLAAEKLYAVELLKYKDIIKQNKKLKAKQAAVYEAQKILRELNNTGANIIFVESLDQEILWGGLIGSDYPAVTGEGTVIEALSYGVKPFIMTPEHMTSFREQIYNDKPLLLPSNCLLDRVESQLSLAVAVAENIKKGNTLIEENHDIVIAQKANIDHQIKTAEDYKQILTNLKNTIANPQVIEKLFKPITNLLFNPEFSPEARKKIITSIDEIEPKESVVFSKKLLSQIDKIVIKEFAQIPYYSLGLSYQPKNNIDNRQNYILAGYPGAIKANLQLIRTAFDKITIEPELSYGSTYWNDLDTLDQQLVQILNITKQRQDLFDELYPPQWLDDAYSLQMNLLYLKGELLKTYSKDNPPPKFEDGVLVSDDVDDRLVDATLLQRRFEWEKQIDTFIKINSTENQLVVINNLSQSLCNHEPFDKNIIFKQISDSLKSLLNLSYEYQRNRLLLILRGMLLQLGRFDKTLVTEIVNMYLKLVDKIDLNKKGDGYPEYIFRIYNLKMELLFPNLKANDKLREAANFFFPIIQCGNIKNLINGLNDMFKSVTLGSEQIEIAKHILNFLPITNLPVEYKKALDLAIVAISKSSIKTKKLIDLPEVKKLMIAMNSILAKHKVKKVAAAASSSSGSAYTVPIMRTSNHTPLVLSDELRLRFKNLTLKRDEFHKALNISNSLDDLSKLQEMFGIIYKDIVSLKANLGKFAEDTEWKEFNDSITELQKNYKIKKETITNANAQITEPAAASASSAPWLFSNLRRSPSKDSTPADKLENVTAKSNKK